MNTYSKLLLRTAALFALLGAFLGSHMAGAQNYGMLNTVHAHILVVGWLSLFAWAVFYQVFYTKTSKLATTHVFSGIIGVIGLTLGMWFYYLNPLQTPDTLNTILFIVGGTVLLISFLLFAILTFTIKDRPNS